MKIDFRGVRHISTVSCFFIIEYIGNEQEIRKEGAWDFFIDYITMGVCVSTYFCSQLLKKKVECYVLYTIIWHCVLNNTCLRLLLHAPESVNLSIHSLLFLKNKPFISV